MDASQQPKQPEEAAAEVGAAPPSAQPVAAAAAAGAGPAGDDVEDQVQGDAAAASPSLPVRHVDADEHGVYHVDNSMCESCGGTGETRIYPFKIPFFRDVILVAFKCDDCSYRSSQVQTSEVRARGIRFELQVRNERDLQRQLIKGDKATLNLPSLQLEVPQNSQKGVFTTLEGILTTVRDNLESDQPVRRHVDPEAAAAIDGFIQRLNQHIEGAEEVLPFTVTLDDPTGNSFIENPSAPEADPNLRVVSYRRTHTQDLICGLNPEGGGAREEGAAQDGAAAGGGGAADGVAAEGFEAAEAALRHEQEEGSGQFAGSNAKTSAAANPDGVHQDAPDYKTGGKIHMETSRSQATKALSAQGDALVFDTSNTDAAKEVMKFPSDCPQCGGRGDVRMCVTDIPHFKEVILMSFKCPHCAWKDVEVRGGGAVPPLGTIHTLKVEAGTPAWSEDLGRDLIKGDSASVDIPELQMHMAEGSLGGVYTTVEGLLNSMRDQLIETNPFSSGESADSADAVKRARFDAFVQSMSDVIEGRRSFTLVIKDPMANSWIYSPADDEALRTGQAPEEAAAAGAEAPTGLAAGKAFRRPADPRLRVRRYRRSRSEDTDLGVADMVAAEAEPDAAAAGEAAAAAASERTRAGDGGRAGERSTQQFEEDFDGDRDVRVRVLINGEEGALDEELTLKSGQSLADLLTAVKPRLPLSPAAYAVSLVPGEAVGAADEAALAEEVRNTRIILDDLDGMCVVLTEQDAAQRAAAVAGVAAAGAIEEAEEEEEDAEESKQADMDEMD